MNVLAVVVLYNVSLNDSQTLNSLKALDSLGINLKLLIYDNSPQQQNHESTQWDYVHDSTNEGLTKAYNTAVELAKKNNCEWLLLLDQDTHLPVGFFQDMKLSDLPDGVDESIPLVKQA